MKQYVVCVYTVDDPIHVSKNKIYELLRDDRGESNGMIRIIDDSNEDYLYPGSWFMPIQIPIEIQQAMTQQRRNKRRKS